MKPRSLWVRFVGVVIMAAGFAVIVNGRGNSLLVLAGGCVVAFGAALFIMGDPT